MSRRHLNIEDVSEAPMVRGRDEHEMDRLEALEDSLFMDEDGQFEHLDWVKPRPFMAELSDWAAEVVYSGWFQKFVVSVIMLNALVVGIQTNRSLDLQFQLAFAVIDYLVVAIFSVEVLLKWAALLPKPWVYFKSLWNVFDFAIVVASFMKDEEYVTVLRLVRLLRVLRLLSILPELQVVTQTLIKSLRSIVSIGFLLCLLFYVYAVLGCFMFSTNDPVHFGTLGLSMLSMLRVITLEDWTDLMYINMDGCKAYGYTSHPERCTHSEGLGFSSVAFFVSFVLIGTYVVLNLFVSAIMANFIDAQKESLSNLLKEQEEEEEAHMEERFREMSANLMQQLRDSGLLTDEGGSASPMVQRADSSLAETMSAMQNLLDAPPSSTMGRRPRTPTADGGDSSRAKDD